MKILYVSNGCKKNVSVKNMKNKSILFILLLLIFAQSASSQAIKGLGLKTGISYANHKWNYTDSYLSKLYKNEPNGVIFFNIGVFGEFLSSDFASTVLDIWYTSKGANFEYNTKDKFGNITGTEEVENRLRYFSVSLTEKIRAESRRQGFGVYLSAGPRLDMLLSRNTDLDYSVTYEQSNVTVFGLALAGGCSFLFTNARLLLEFFYNPDFGKTIDNQNGTVKSYDYGFRVGIEGIFKKR